MKIDNPFTNGQIKNYLFFYLAILIIITLFFIASTLFNDIQKVDRKVFSTELKKTDKQVLKIKKEPNKFRLLDNPY